ncbi:AAA family ATPase [Desulfobacterales bacterium HSG17]|nr:AAA family ATPase [Desulfobacterales bacterium HSG17]
MGEQSSVLESESIDGMTLKTFVESKKTSLAYLIKIMIQVAQSLGELHQLGIIHKNVNSSNILIRSQGAGAINQGLEENNSLIPNSQFLTPQISIIDFGISSKINVKTAHMGNPEHLEGTLAYISPEQTGRMNRIVDYRADLYSLGVTFYEIFTGKLPFDYDDPMELVHAHIAKKPLSVQELGEDSYLSSTPQSLIPIISDIIMKLMAKNAEDRYQSAFGLKRDLEQVLAQVQDTSKDPHTFELGTHDISGKFQIPQKLYGRENELAKLMQVFERVASSDLHLQETSYLKGTGRSELMLIAGYSGVGKSALVHEIHKPITEKQGFFISGKFDQFQRNIPYTAFIQALNQFCDYLLMENEESLNTWKNSILDVAGNNGQVLIDIIPNLEKVIGKQPSLVKVGLQETQNRFNLYFQYFMRAISTAEHPLVMFIDDLQRADLPSLNLLKLILNDSENSHILIIGAYRDNEVHVGHPFLMTIEELEKAGTFIEQIKLDNLSQEDMSNLMVDALGMSNLGLTDKAGIVAPLADLVYEKTHGNAFFMTQFLQTVYEKGLLTFDFKQSQWTWDIEQIKTMQISDNVVELMAGKISSLDDAIQQTLQMASCIGNTFDLETLAVIMPDESEIELFPKVRFLNEQLLHAVKEGLLVPLGKEFKYLESIGISIFCKDIRFLLKFKRYCVLIMT